MCKHCGKGTSGVSEILFGFALFAFVGGCLGGGSALYVYGQYPIGLGGALFGMGIGVLLCIKAMSDIDEP